MSWYTSEQGIMHPEWEGLFRETHGKDIRIVHCRLIDGTIRMLIPLITLIRVETMEHHHRGAGAVLSVICQWAWPLLMLISTLTFQNLIG
jgi:hypothetical protein